MHVSAPTQASFALGELSYINAEYNCDAVPAPTRQDSHHGVLHWVHDLTHWLAVRHQKHIVMQELAIMSDRELSDIGLSRADVGHIFDTDFRSDTRGGDYIGY